MIHTVEGFGIVNKAEIDVFLELSCIFDDPADAGNLISGSSAFSQPRDWIWVSCIVGKFFTVWATRDAWNCYSKRFSYLLRLCGTAFEPLDIFWLLLLPVTLSTPSLDAFMGLYYLGLSWSQWVWPSLLIVGVWRRGRRGIQVVSNLPINHIQVLCWKMCGVSQGLSRFRGFCKDKDKSLRAQ